MKITVRLSKKLATIQDLLKPEHDLSGPDLNWAGIEGSELYFGTSYAGQPQWVPFITAGTVSNLQDLQNQGSSSIIFIPIDSRYMIFTFGYGHQELSGEKLETDFGLKVSLNAVNPAKIKSIDSKIMGPVVMNRRTQLSKEKEIHDFGFEINKDFLRFVVGKPLDENFGTSLEGGDNLILNCTLQSTEVEGKVVEIYELYKSLNYRANYSWVDNIKSLRDNDLISNLNIKLIEEINNLLLGNPGNVELAAPDILDQSLIDHFNIRGIRSTTDLSYIDINNFVSQLLIKEIHEITLPKLKNYRIEAVGRGGEIINNWYLFEWLIFEVNYSGNSYILLDGEWFSVSTEYSTLVNNSFQTIINTLGEYQHLGTTTAHSEEDYIENYTPVGNEAILDRELVYIYGRYNSIEICDIYNDRKEFVHVKDYSGSNVLSHLFNQGFVSASAFLNDPGFRSKIKEKVNSNPAIADTITDSIKPSNFTVVYRILKEGTNFSLPFFSKIVLIEIHKKIKSMGFKFRLESLQKV